MVSDEQAVPETRGVTAELVGSVDLGAELEGMEGRHLRIRAFTFGDRLHPAGHDHGPS
jgi:hypothetical protein